MMKYQNRYAGVTATTSVAEVALASMGKDGKARMGNTDRISTGAGYFEFLGWRHATPEMRESLLSVMVVKTIVENWYGDVNASNIAGAKRLLRLFEVAPDDSLESYKAAWSAYKSKVDPDKAIASTPATAQDLAAMMAANPELLVQALQALQAQTQQAQQVQTQTDAARDAFAKIKGRKVKAS